ncbi:MMPL family transporter [Actinomycetota bacterium]
MERGTIHRTYDWLGRHIVAVVAAAIVLVVGLGIIGPMVADTNDADFEPDGPLFATYEEATSVLTSTSTVSVQTWLVESTDRGADTLTATTLLEWKTLADRVRVDPAHAEHLVSRYDPATGTETPGLLSIADIVDLLLPNGLATATDAQVDAALDAAFAEDSPFADFRYSLSEQATRTDDGWFSPAFTTQVVYDTTGFVDEAAEEAWLRTVQDDLRADAALTDSIGVAIDPGLSFGEAAEQSAPYIFLAVALILLLVAFVHRSYWSSVVVGAGLTATTLAAYGTSALLGLKMGSLLLAFVVPIAMISFGVDFYIHGLGRVREAQVDDGHDVSTAYPLGMRAVFVAMLLAVSSSIAAFLSNAASGIEAIIQFGVGSALSLGFAYLFLGQIAPRVTVGVEAWIGDDPVKGVSRYVYAAGMLIVAVMGGLSVAMAAVMPAIGLVTFAIFSVAFVALPAFVTRRRNRRARIAGRQLVHGHAGAAHGLDQAGWLVHLLAKWRFVTIPVVVVIGALGLVQAMSVSSGFEIEDFLSTDTDFAQSIDRVSGHYPSSGEGTSFIYIEGDLTDPDNLAAIDATVAQLRTSGADFGTNGDGEMIVALHAADIVRMVVASPAAEVIADSGPSLADADGNGLPDSGAAIAAIYRHVAEFGVTTPDGAPAISAADTAKYIAQTDAGYATDITIQVGSFTDGAIIEPVEAALTEAAIAHEAMTTGVRARVSGDVLTSYYGMDSFTRSMLVSMPLALLLALVLAMAMLRSVRFAIVSVLPIGLVVIGLYAFMATFGYTVNVVTATIAAIAVGVGIDFSTHFTARYREELEGPGDALDAVRRAGRGTGGALVLSALTSVLGFLVMALAPTPIFATFGILTAVMIALSLAVSTLVLPSLLVLVTPATHMDGVADLEEVLEPVAV